MTPDKVALFDMDGTLANYDSALRSEMEKLYPGKVGVVVRNENDPAAEHARMLIQGQPGFWRNLKPYRPGFIIMLLARAIGFTPHILTKGPRKTVGAWSEKVEWCQIHVPDVPITITSDKSLVYGRVLVDDWPEYFLPWLEKRPRGVVIAPRHSWNESIKHPRVLVYDEASISSETLVREWLQAAFNRSQ